ncbi:hypothetical protein BDV06DRAFT_200493 [Aspergillus oleicola]
MKPLRRNFTGGEARGGLRTDEHQKGICVECHRWPSRFMCLICRDVDLCDRCRDAVHQGRAENNGCQSHGFFSIPRRNDYCG